MEDKTIVTALTKLTTANQWSLLSAVLTKLKKQKGISHDLDLRTFATFLVSSNSGTNLTKHGIWIETVSATCPPII